MSRRNKAKFDFESLPPEVRADLDRLAGVILNAELRATGTGVEIGAAFRAAKEHFSHGTFLAWCHDVVGFEPRRAQLYMNLPLLFARYGDDLLNVPLSAALLLGSPSVGPETVGIVLSRVRRGERVTVEWVKQLIRSAKAASDRSSERIDHRSVEIARLIAQAIGVQGCMVLQMFLNDKPPVRHFVKDLAESAAAEVRRRRRHTKVTPVVLSLTAAT